MTGPPSRIASTPRRLFGSMRPRAFAGYLIPLRCGCLRIGAIPVAGLRRGGADGRVVRDAAAFSGDAALNGSRAPHQGRATRSEHLGCPAPAARAQRAHHRRAWRLLLLGKRHLCPFECLVTRPASTSASFRSLPVTHRLASQLSLVQTVGLAARAAVPRACGARPQHKQTCGARQMVPE